MHLVRLLSFGGHRVGVKLLRLNDLLRNSGKFAGSYPLSVGPIRASPHHLDRVNYDIFILDAAKTNLLRHLHPFCKDSKIVKVNTGVLLPHELVLKAVKTRSSPLSIARVEVQLQWQGLLDSFAQPITSVSRRLIIPMCDVS